MSLHRAIRRLSRPFGAALVAVSLLFVGACTVRPLYGDAGVGADGGAAALLASIEVKPVTTRQALEVRNHLIFLLSGGAGQPAEPQYLLDLDVKSTVESAATVQIATDNEPSAGTVRMVADYALIDTGTGQPVATGTRTTSAAFDRLRQEFANVRAERDAENRAARELAELLRLAVVQDLGMAKNL